jgi:peptidoglycan/xylan/chitin deacetylase (PgdA/CDA1 family)
VNKALLASTFAIAGVLVFSYSLLMTGFGSLVMNSYPLTSKFNLNPLPTPDFTPTPLPSPTPRPLTFAEMDERYGPCVNLPVLMYHHVQSAEAAAKNQTGLTVTTPVFRSQMEYLKQHGYISVGAEQLLQFFDNGVGLPAKAVLLTFDDGYEDFYTDAFPVLREMDFKAVMFLPTGLMENPDYLRWEQIEEMRRSGLVLFANHTWSHKNVRSTIAVAMEEMRTADEQLSSRGLNVPKVFAYPYGLGNDNTLANLNTLGYRLAFATTPGKVLCEKHRLILPRIRVGNSALSNYGI